MITVFLIGYLVIALSCVGVGYYLSYPDHTWGTLKDDALNLLRRRSRPAPVDPWPSVQHDEEAKPAEEPAHPLLAQQLVALGEAIKSAPTLDEIHARQVADALTPVSDESHEEAAPVEVVHDEP